MPFSEGSNSFFMIKVEDNNIFFSVCDLETLFQKYFNSLILITLLRKHIQICYYVFILDIIL